MLKITLYFTHVSHCFTHLRACEFDRQTLSSASPVADASNYGLVWAVRCLHHMFSLPLYISFTCPYLFSYTNCIKLCCLFISCFRFFTSLKQPVSFWVADIGSATFNHGVWSSALEKFTQGCQIPPLLHHKGGTTEMDENTVQTMKDQI